MTAEANFRNADDRSAEPRLDLFRTPKKIGLGLEGAGESDLASRRELTSIGLFRRSNWRATLRS